MTLVVVEFAGSGAMRSENALIWSSAHGKYEITQHASTYNYKKSKTMFFRGKMDLLCYFENIMDSFSLFHQEPVGRNKRWHVAVTSPELDHELDA